MARLIAALMFTSLCIAGCGGGGGGSQAGAAAVAAAAAPAVTLKRFADTEPNDSASPQVLGRLTVGGAVYNGSGRVTFSDAAGDDEFDTFQLIADSDQLARVVVSHDGNNDIDVTFIDPNTGALLTETCDQVGSPQECELALTRDQVVNVELEAFDTTGSVAYTLEIRAVAP